MVLSRVVACCACLAAVCLTGAATAVDDGDGGGGGVDEEAKPDFRTVSEQLDSRVRSLFGRFRGGGGGVRAASVAQDGGGTTAADGPGDTADGATAVAAAEPDRRAKYATQSDCESANGGRPCVCLVADFLARLRRTDDAAADQTDTTSVAEYECPSYAAAPKTFVVSAAAATATAAVQEASSGAAADNGTVRKPVYFEHVIHYSLRRSLDDHYVVHYGLVSSDLKIRCLQHNMPDGDSTNTTEFKWDTTNHKSNSTITGFKTNTLMILGLDPKDSKNYTCVVSTFNATEKTTETSYKHHVIAVERPVYEIRGTVVYQTSSGGCKNKTISPVRKQLPGLVLGELCPDGLSGYACNVVFDTFKCSEDDNTLEISYLITPNDNVNSIIRSTKKGHNALHYQKMLAGVSEILALNLYKLSTVTIVSKYSLFNTNFKPDHESAKIDSFVSCPPGFGIREIFCAACPPHHYSPNTSADCSKCPTGYHQPVTGSDSCVKCPSIFADGCPIITPMQNAPMFFFYAMVFIFLFVLLVVVASCAFCCREEGENEDIKVIPRQIRKKFKKKKGYETLRSDTYDTSDTDTARTTSASIKQVPKTVQNENPKQKVKTSEPVSMLTYKKLAED